MSVVLMYHALYPDGDLSQIDVEDQPYAVSESTFKQHLDMLKPLHVGIFSDDNTQALPDVVITFDDGHISNYEIALPLLQQAGYSAYFFATTHFINSREYFCRPEQLKALAEAGMVVGSHGVSHEFLADLPPDAVEHELKHSRSVLESWVNQDIHSLSFPGGRYTPAVMDRARSAGYRQIFDSTFDTVSVTDLAEQKPLARVAIRRSTSADDFQRMITRDGSLYRKVQRAQWIKQTLKHTLGNRLYHGLYKSLTAHR